MMNIMAIIRAATMGDPRRVWPMVAWAVLEYMLRGAPYGIVLAVTWVLFDPLTNPGTPINITALVWLSVSLLVSLTLLHLVSRCSYLAMFDDAYGLCTDGRLAMGDHLRKLPMGFFNARDPGTIGAYLINDYANIEHLFTHLVPQAIGALAMPLILLLALATQSWQLALAAALVIPLAIPFTFVSRAFIRFFGKQHQKAKVEAASRMLEYVQGMHLIKAFNLAGAKFERLELVFRRLKALSIKLEAGSGPTVLLSGFVLQSGQTLIILLGLTLLFADTIALPVYIMFLILGVRVYEPLMQALTFLAELNYFKISVDRIEDVYKTPALSGTQPTLRPTSYDLAFENVSFHYLDNDVLNDISVNIPARSLVALVGPSGSGKTTMTRLIARFWDVTAGRITLGGHDLRAYDPATVLAAISMVFQDVYLFNDTVLNNIRVGRTEATQDEVIAAAKAARCHDFVSRLPEGYETLVGEGGSTLSGGEKQRISIARAILKDAPIILLDEATASLDPENELYIQEAIGALVRDKTVIVIAHRLNTVVHADNIVVLEGGRIVEQGKHDDLMRVGGLYCHMWDEQQQVRAWKFAQEESLAAIPG
ncbi:ABC transporter ATP-binding protein [Candidatus Chloroploca asiatica]|uniref:Multidrug ABC transporter n=1 Tax=Candidatus Chloroploca asiatica TaxID=1506545 RepID=A0A2H3KNL8_9CHLR|nr:ABC transporter ATP-binding protein [Candidatus Chloroploca asiatica]PDV98986.1 multidrug ABC transporter [Candidatus Chloroploca asiatica]